MCGENALVSLAYVDKVGSPPRVRGKQTCLANILNESRITPACAGKTDSGRNNMPLQKDHPRVCGENLEV